MHYLAKLQAKQRDDAPATGGVEPLAKFLEEMPFLFPPSMGWEPVNAEKWQWVKNTFQVRTKMDYLKHLLSAHDGEARFVGSDLGAAPISASGEESCYDAAFWHCQFARTAEVKQYLWRRWQGETSAKWDDPMTQWEIDWILKKEKNRTHLLRYKPATGGWEIRTGRYITLAEMFWYGHEMCTCFDLYRTYLACPIFIEKRYHSFSTSDHSRERRAAKALRFHEHGRWGFPSHRR